LHVFARNIQLSIHHVTGDAKFCLIIDEALDEFRREQMTLTRTFCKHKDIEVPNMDDCFFFNMG
jgi:hypothetical protein